MLQAGYIDGVFVTGSGEILAVEDPSDGREIARLAGLSAPQVEDAIRAARLAFDRGVWSELAVAERAAALRRFVAALAQREAKLAEVTVAETGCPPHSGTMRVQVKAPLRMALECIDFFAALPEIEENPLPLAERATPTGMMLQSLRRYTPIGVVAAIAAYNFPFYTAIWKVIPALMAGNTVVVRPNPLTPLSAMILGEAAEEAKLPPGVLNVVLEAGHDGARLLTTHPAVDMVAFTGSTAVGAQVAIQAAPTFKRVQLELGGKSAQIFLPDAVNRFAAQAVVVCTAHAGQGCALGTRLFVPEAQKAELVEQAAAAFRRLKVGPALDPETQVGPVISAAQVARCEHFVKLAVENGGRVAAGGARPSHLDRGHYFEPTLLDLPDNSNPAAQEEIFGPVVSVIGYRDLDHAVEMANDSKYGLSGYVHGEDAATALKVGARVRSGSVHVNAAVMSTYASFGGQRASGYGRERGVEGMRLYQQLSCLTLGG
ncbi:aldehyde dehydrogenase family protein [Phenylobacterium sp. LjRoot225]|uniref:aldehyde dehydrogenase family protein n=1 Tax=Phenylobacterium sp. LjRoot225 TaxID=3342285 RepID=UPI003ECEB57C